MTSKSKAPSASDTLDDVLIGKPINTGADASATISGEKLDTSLLGTPATGATPTPATGEPPAAPQGVVSTSVLDPSLTDKDAILDRLMKQHAADLTPEVHKQAALRADTQREHGQPPAFPDASLTSLLDIPPRSPSRDADPDYADFREVTVKLGAPAEADYCEVGATVARVNAVSGEITFRVAKGSKAFDSVRAHDVLRGS